VLEASYPAVVTDGRREFVPEPWGDDPRLVAVLGERGAAGFRALLDGFPDSVGVLWAIRDADGGGVVDFAFGYGNPAMLSGFRLPAETRDRYTLLGALPQMRESRMFDEYIRVCEMGEPLVGEVTYDTPFGDGYMLGTFLHRAARLGDGVIVFLHDVTASRRMEAELVAYADVVAHDLSAPLAGIAMLVNVLELRPDEPPAPEVLHELRATSGRARELVDGVLDYARSGELVLEPVSLEAVAAEVVTDLRVQLEAAGASVVTRELPEVRADPRQLRRVLQNLVGNALKFHGHEPPRVEITAGHGGEEWIVTVRDNGIGVSREDARRIFGMFTRVERRVEGSGIGLAVCRRVVEAHGGRIWVEPAEGGGSAFRFTLPFDAAS
jgi:signal transduction histidine kinase